MATARRRYSRRVGQKAFSSSSAACSLLVGCSSGRRAEANASADPVLWPAGALLGFALAVDQAAGGRDRADLGEVVRASLGAGAEGREVNERRRPDSGQSTMPVGIGTLPVDARSVETVARLRLEDEHFHG